MKHYHIRFCFTGNFSIKLAGFLFEDGVKDSFL